MPFGLRPDSQTALFKYGKQANCAFNPSTDKKLTSIDRHGNAHAKALVSANYACMAITEGGWSLISVEQFLSRGFVSGGKLNPPAGTRLLFKGDLVFSPKKRAFYKIGYFSADGGACLIRATETATFDNLKKTGLSIQMGTRKDLSQLVRLDTIYELRQLCKHNSAQHAT
jgi:hypothetical protein